MKTKTLMLVLAVAAVLGIFLGLVAPKADAVSLKHRHSDGTRHIHNPGGKLAELIAKEHGLGLLHDDPNRPDESHDYDVQPKDGTTTIRYDDGSAEVMQVMGDTATYDGRMLVWDPHGGGSWKDPEDPYFGLIMWPPYPPEFPIPRAIELDMSAGPGNYIQRRGNW